MCLQVLGSLYWPYVHYFILHHLFYRAFIGDFGILWKTDAEAKKGKKKHLSVNFLSVYVCKHLEF